MFRTVFFMSFLFSSATMSKTGSSSPQYINKQNTPVIEIRCYNLKPGKAKQFGKSAIEKVMPLLSKAKIKVLAFGASVHDENSWYLIRAYNSLTDMTEKEELFYESSEWKNGPREEILNCIKEFTTTVLSADSTFSILSNINFMVTNKSLEADKLELSRLNALFIQNFLNQDVATHQKIIHDDFICIESNGKIVDRGTYMKDWATSFSASGYLTFEIGEESIRIFENIALVRSVTTYTKNDNGNIVTGHSVYTDTYVKENGKWLCVEAHITPVKQ